MKDLHVYTLFSILLLKLLCHKSMCMYEKAVAIAGSRNDSMNVCTNNSDNVDQLAMQLTYIK